jgi:hypothetical protein
MREPAFDIFSGRTERDSAVGRRRMKTFATVLGHPTSPFPPPLERFPQPAGDMACWVALTLLRACYQDRAMSAAPPRTNATPEAWATRCPLGKSFSAMTRHAIAATHRRFMTPATKSKAIKIQQHPTQ